MPTRQDYHERIQTILGLLTQENIQRGREPVNEQDRIIDKKLNTVRTMRDEIFFSSCDSLAKSINQRVNACVLPNMLYN